MRSIINPDFHGSYRKLPAEVRRDAQAAYQLFRRDPFARSLYFKEVYPKKNIWFWIGSHAEYDFWFRRFKQMP